MKLRYKIINGILIVLAVAIVSLVFVLSHTAPCGPAPAISGDTDLMKAIVYRCYGSPDVLTLEDVVKPAPADDELLVRVRAAAVNPLDWHNMRGSPYFIRLASGLGAPKDIRLGVDFAGTVADVGRNVTRFKPGDDVFGAANGAFAEYLIVSADRAVVAKPENMSFAQAAAVPIAAITALQALRDKGQVKPGQKVLINGASGGVGTFAVQIARSLGAEVYGVCSTRNVEMLRSLGADHVYDYTQEDYTESGEIYDVIVDMVGNHELSANRRVLAAEGKLVIVGGPKGDWFRPLLSPIKAMLLSPFVDQEIGMMLARMTQADLTTLSDLMQSGQVTPVIDQRFALHEVPAAMRYSEAGHARGKIVIDVD